MMAMQSMKRRCERLQTAGTPPADATIGSVTGSRSLEAASRRAVPSQLALCGAKPVDLEERGNVDGTGRPAVALEAGPAYVRTRLPGTPEPIGAGHRSRQTA